MDLLRPKVQKTAVSRPLPHHRHRALRGYLVPQALGLIAACGIALACRERATNAKHEGPPPAELPSSGSSHDEGAREMLARGLARGVPASGATLEQLLHDGAARTVAWAAFGLGQHCRGHEEQWVPALVTRAASLTLDPTARRESGVTSALTLALSRCGGKQAERSLASWLNLPDTRDDAALALARLADTQRALEDGTLVGLLDTAGNPQQPTASALLAIDRLAGVSASAAARVSDVAKVVLQSPEPQQRACAISALVHGDDSADDLLLAVAGNDAMTLRERALAVRSLSRRSGAGTTQLTKLLQTLDARIKANTLRTAPWPVFLATLRALPADAPPALHKLLQRWATFVIPEQATVSLHNRITQARCLAATLLVQRDSLDPRLTGCDPGNGITGALAQIEVLDRGEIRGKRLLQWQQLLRSDAARVQQGALKLLAGHRELEATGELTRALRAAEPGTVVAAASLLAAHPDRASDEGGVAESIVKALTEAFDRQFAPDQIPVRGTLAEAAAALQLLSLKSKVEQLCKSPIPVLRDKARRALGMLGEREPHCPAPPAAPAATAGAAGKATVRIVFETDSGEHSIELRPDLAPHSVQRVVDLVGEGFYDKLAIHRAAPGQVVQLGDPLGDGYGGCGREPIVSEPSYQHFAALSVGMADFGTDTASSQLFITLSDSPQLDGAYTWIGTASASWEELVIEDVIVRARVR